MDLDTSADPDDGDTATIPDTRETETASSVTDIAVDSGGAEAGPSTTWTFDCGEPVPGETLPRCWTYYPGTVDEIVRFTSTPAVADGRVYVTTVRDDDERGYRAYLHAVDFAGHEVWRVDHGLPDQLDPPVVADDGSLYLVGRKTIGNLGAPSGVVFRFSAAGEYLWDTDFEPALWDPDELVEWVVFGLQSDANAVDKEGNLYAVAAANLYSFSPEGQVRWRIQVTDPAATNCPNYFNGVWAPAILGDRVFVASNRDRIMVASLDGSFVNRTRTWFYCARFGWSFAHGDRFVLTKESTTAVFDRDGEPLWEYDFGRQYEADAFDRQGVMYSTGLRADDGQTLLWEERVANPPYGTLIIDRNGRGGYMTSGHFVTFDTATGTRLSDDPVDGSWNRRWPDPELAPVMIADGIAVAIMNDFRSFPNGGIATLIALRAPLDLPDPAVWSTVHGNFKNQRRVDSLAPAPLEP